MRPEQTVQDMAKRTRRLSAIAAMLETFDTPADRARIIYKLENCGMLSGQVADLLRETYAPEVRL